MNLLIAVLTVGTARAGSVTLAWDPSPSTTVTGYRIYYGTAPGTYTQFLAVGNTNRATVTGLSAGVRYYFAATALSSSGLESAFSTEVSQLVPSPTQPSLVVRITPQKEAVLFVTGPAGYTYEVQGSQTFSKWLSLGTVTLNAAGSAQFTDTNAAAYPARFYRLRLLSAPQTARLFLRLNAQKQAVVSLAGAPGFTYEIQGAGALGQWQALGTVTANSAGAAQFTDTAATSQPRRFYRARQVTS
ncbi:MAG TPA: fibronectin type III domain-containing protein [Verrucomicrobiota bacterium]|nr:fibronectin type III domain-containing protein [Verrucomicrobiota bacterium]HRT06816.1 fibronectin type III domain-containing protein [Candidatus Paceibacterota bacterium]HRT58443.1 fibronectin type III domain-containing protein [Candidatus Paceibacterota bacterium]